MLDTEEVIREVGVGEAVTSMLEEKACRRLWNAL
jgi:hypothetical protein